VFTLGVGTKKGAKIPYHGTYKKDNNGNFVHTSLNERALRELSQITGGSYALATNKTQVEKLFDDIKKIEGAEQGEKEVNENKKALYFPYLLIALLLILLDFVLLVPMFKLR
jgi:Ca-activated chloride channel family protein